MLEKIQRQRKEKATRRLTGHRFCSDKCRTVAWQANREHTLARLEENLTHALAQDQAICERRTRPGPVPTGDWVMVETPDRRRVARLAVPSHLGGFEVEPRLGRLLDLSAEGVRIEHPGHLHEGLALFVDLPADLGGVRLTGQVVWTKLRKGEQTVEGDKHVYYQSDLAFIRITPEQQAALAVALAILKTGEGPAGA